VEAFFKKNYGLSIVPPQIVKEGNIFLCNLWFGALRISFASTTFKRGGEVFFRKKGP
jgi:hypothetical protein